VEDPRLQLGISEDEYTEFERLAALGEAEDWQRLLSMLIKVESELSASSYPRLLLEMALVRAASLPPARRIEDLVRKLEQLGTHGSSTQGSGGAKGTSGGGSRGGVFESAEVNSAHERSSTPESRPESASGADNSDDKGEKCAKPPAQEMISQNQRQKSSLAAEDSGGDSSTSDTGGGAAHPTQEADWGALVQQVGKKNPRIGALLDNVSLLELKPPLLRLGAGKGSFLLQQLKDKETQEKICELTQILLGEKITLKVEGLAAQQAPPSLQQSKQQQESDRSRRLREDAINHPIVRKAVEIFAGEVVDVTPNDKGYV
jgi:DNA polymerase-3 subunit gamma/tau